MVDGSEGNALTVVTTLIQLCLHNVCPKEVHDVLCFIAFLQQMDTAFDCKCSQEICMKATNMLNAAR